MKGSIIRRGRKYSVVIDLGQDPGTGKRVRKWHSGFSTRREAEAARIELLGLLQRGTYVAPIRQTLGDFLMGTWLPTARPTIRPSTYQSYEHNMAKHVVPRIGRIALQDVSPVTLNTLYAELLASGRLDGNGGLSPKTVRYIHTILHRVFRDACKWNLLGRNPATSADPPKPKNYATRQMKTWSATELRELLHQVQDSRTHPALHLMAVTGMRRGEALGLRWVDVDLGDKRIAIRQTLISVAYEVQISEPKTDRGRRSIALDERTVSILRQHRTTQLRERLAAGSAWQDLGLVFTRQDGSPIHPDAFSKEFDRLVRASGLPRIRLHDLRHTFATLALKAGAHPKVVSERLKHSQVSVTLDTYSHVLPSLQEALADQIAGMIHRPSRPEEEGDVATSHPNEGQESLPAEAESLAMGSSPQRTKAPPSADGCSLVAS